MSFQEIKKGTSKEAPNQIQNNINTKEKLLSILTDKPQSKEELSAQMNTSERSVRKAVEELRREGVPVVSSSHLKGYWLGTKEEAMITAKEYKSRAMRMLRTARALELGEDVGQVSMEEIWKH